MMTHASCHILLALTTWFTTGHAAAWTQEDRSPVPNAEALETLRSEVRRLYPDQYKAAQRSKKARKELVASLLNTVDRLGKSETGARYATLVEALELALEASDLSTALEIVDHLDAAFEPVDALALEIQAIIQVAQGVTRSDSAFVAAAGLELADQCLDNEDETRAALLLEAISKPVRSSGDESLRKSWDAYRDGLTKLQDYLKARQDLEQSPANPADNQVVGRYLAFQRLELVTALPYLAKGPDGDLTRCARMDIAKPSVPAEQKAVGDAWLAWSKGKVRRTRALAQTRARYWYERSVSALPSFERIEVENKLAELKSVEPPRRDPIERAPRSTAAKRGSTGGRDDLVADAMRSGRDWLVQNQGKDGRWSSHAWGGKKHHDVGVTSLAVLALLESTESMGRRDVDSALNKAVDWLFDQHDEETGQFGREDGHDWIYNHLLATYTLCKVYGTQKTAEMKEPLQGALDFIERARNPYSAWRYEQPNNDNDTSITSWAVRALVAGKESGLRVEEEALEGAMTWLNSATDATNGRIGYNDIGTASSRGSGVDSDYPRDGDESMTASGLCARILLGQSKSEPILSDHVDLMLQSLPEHYGGERMAAKTNYLYYWFHGTEALYLLRTRKSKAWRRWSKAVESAVLAAWSAEESTDGSWKPDGPWGSSGGRVYSTSLAILTLAKVR